MFSFIVSLYFLHTELHCEKILRFLGRVSTKYAKKTCQNFACLYIIQIPGLLYISETCLFFRRAEILGNCTGYLNCCWNLH